MTRLAPILLAVATTGVVTAQAPPPAQSSQTFRTGVDVTTIDEIGRAHV